MYLFDSAVRHSCLTVSLPGGVNREEVCKTDRPSGGSRPSAKGGGGGGLFKTDYEC